MQDKQPTNYSQSAITYGNNSLAIVINPPPPHTLPTASKNIQSSSSSEDKKATIVALLELVDGYTQDNKIPEACLKAIECCGVAIAVANYLVDEDEKEAHIDLIIKKIMATIKENFVYSEIGPQISPGIQIHDFANQLRRIHTELSLIRLESAPLYKKYTEKLQRFHKILTNRLFNLFKDICQFSFDMMGFDSTEQTSGIALVLLGSLATMQAMPTSGVKYIILLSEEIASKNRGRYLALADLIEMIVIAFGETLPLHITDSLRAKGLNIVVSTGFCIDADQKPTAGNAALSMVGTPNHYTNSDALKTFSSKNQLSSLLLMPRFLMGDKGLFETYHNCLRQAIQYSLDHHKFIRQLASLNLSQQKDFINIIKMGLLKKDMSRPIDIETVSLYHLDFARELVALMVAAGTLESLPDNYSFWCVFEKLRVCFEKVDIYNSWYQLVEGLQRVKCEIILENLQNGNITHNDLTLKGLITRLQIDDCEKWLKSLTKIHSALTKLCDETIRALMNSSAKRAVPAPLVRPVPERLTSKPGIEEDRSLLSSEEQYQTARRTGSPTHSGRQPTPNRNTSKEMQEKEEEPRDPTKGFGG